MSDLKKLKEEFLLKLREKLDLSEMNQIKSDLFGKNGLISLQFKKIGTIAETKRKKFASPPLDEIFQWTCHLQDRRVANDDECFLKLGGACACELRLPINPTPWDHILDRMARQEATSATPR